MVQVILLLVIPFSLYLLLDACLRRHDKVCFAIAKATAVIGEQSLWPLFLVILAAFPFVIPATCHSREIGKGIYRFLCSPPSKDLLHQR